MSNNEIGPNETPQITGSGEAFRDTFSFMEQYNELDTFLKTYGGDKMRDTLQAFCKCLPSQSYSNTSTVHITPKNHMDGTIQTIPPQHLSDNLVDTEHGIHPWLSKQMVKISAFQTPTKNTKIQKTKEAINQTLFPGQGVEKDQNQDIDQDIDSEITNTILLIYLAITDQVAMDPLEYLQDYDDRKPYIKEIKAIIEEEETNFYPENQYLDLLMGINEDLKRDYRLTSDQPLDSAGYIQQITEELKKDNVINTCIRDRDINIDNVTMIMKYYNIILQEKSQYKQTTERRKKALEKRLKGILKIGEDCELELAYIGDTIKDHSKKKIEGYYSAYYKTYMRYNDPQDGDDFYNDDNEHIRG